MRLIPLIFTFLCLGAASLFAQHKPLLYDFNPVPQGLMLNPGMEAEQDWFVGVPMVSGLFAQAGSSGVTVNDLFANDGIDFNQKIRERAIYSMSQRDEFSGTYQVEIFYAGIRFKNRPEDLFTIGLYNEGLNVTYWPKDLAILLFEGNADQYGRQFDLSHLNSMGEVLNVYHIGLTRTLNREWTVGIRGKLYAGMMDYRTVNNSGFFLTDEGQRNLVSNTLVAAMEMRTSGISDFLDGGGVADNSVLLKRYAKRGMVWGDLGLGIDLGFTHHLSEQTVLTASLLDLGFVHHGSDPYNYTLNGSATVEGVEIILPGALADPDADVWQDLVDEVDGLVPFEENQESYTSMRPLKMYASLRHNWGEPFLRGDDCECSYKPGATRGSYGYTNGVGGMLFMINRPLGPQIALSGFYQRRIGNNLALKTTYTIDKFSATNIGLGMAGRIGPVQLYLMADNLLAYSNLADAHTLSFQFGLNIVSSGRK